MAIGRSLIELLASRLSHPRSIQYSNKSILQDQHSVVNYYAFSPFRLIAKILKKTEKEKTKKIKFDITMLANRVAIPPDIENVDKRTCTPSINIVVNQALTLMA